jgi:hypothetical protein
MTAEVSGEIVYVLPSGTLTYDGIALLQDIIAGASPGGSLTDGDKGDITVSGAGTVWTIDSGAVDWAEVSGKPATFPPDAHTQAASTITDLATTVQAYTLDTFANPVASLDFAQQQTLQFVIENRTSDPGSPATGQIWLRTDL